MMVERINLRLQEENRNCTRQFPLAFCYHQTWLDDAMTPRHDELSRRCRSQVWELSSIKSTSHHAVACCYLLWVGRKLKHFINNIFNSRTWWQDGWKLCKKAPKQLTMSCQTCVCAFIRRGSNLIKIENYWLCISPTRTNQNQHTQHECAVSIIKKFLWRSQGTPADTHCCALSFTQKTLIISVEEIFHSITIEIEALFCFMNWKSPQRDLGSPHVSFFCIIFALSFSIWCAKIFPSLNHSRVLNNFSFPLEAG